MRCDELYQLIIDPATLSEKTLPDLKQIVDDFPCFQAARMLYLKNLAVVEDIRLNAELKKMAIHIPDRMKLFMLIESAPPPPKPRETVEKEKPFDAVEDYLSKTEASESKSSHKPFVFEPSASIDYMSWLAAGEQNPDSSQAKLQHQELIDSFIVNESERSRSRIKLEPLKSDDDTAQIIAEQENSDKSPETSYFTETLAYVYIKQKRFDKALEIIKSLSLKYPEKNIYFADQIRFLEKLIIHTKKQ